MSEPLTPSHAVTPVSAGDSALALLKVRSALADMREIEKFLELTLTAAKEV